MREGERKWVVRRALVLGWEGEGRRVNRPVRRWSEGGMSESWETKGKKEEKLTASTSTISNTVFLLASVGSIGSGDSNPLQFSPGWRTPKWLSIPFNNSVWSVLPCKLNQDLNTMGQQSWQSEIYLLEISNSSPIPSTEWSLELDPSLLRIYCSPLVLLESLSHLWWGCCVRRRCRSLSLFRRREEGSVWKKGSEGKAVGWGSFISQYSHWGMLSW